MNKLITLDELLRTLYQRQAADERFDEWRDSGKDSIAIGRYLATLNNVRATRFERLRRWLRVQTFGAIK